MVFKNMVVYRLPEGWKLNAQSIEASLEKHKGRTCGATEWSVFGWEPVFDDVMVHSVMGHRLIKMRVEEKILPSGVVKKELKKRVALMERQQGRKPGKKEQREMKETIELELLPKAFTRERESHVWIDQNGMWVGVEASSRKKADDVISAMVNCIDNCPPIQTIVTQESPSSVMRRWLAEKEASDGFSIDDTCDLVGCGEVKSSVKYSKHALDGEDMEQHLNEGKVPVCLGVTYDENMAFVFNENMDLKRIELIGFKEDDSEHAQEGFDAMFLAFVETVSPAIYNLVLACGGEGEPQSESSEESERSEVEAVAA